MLRSGANVRPLPDHTFFAGSRQSMVHKTHGTTRAWYIPGRTRAADLARHGCCHLATVHFLPDGAVDPAWNAYRHPGGEQESGIKSDRRMFGVEEMGDGAAAIRPPRPALADAEAAENEEDQNEEQNERPVVAADRSGARHRILPLILKVASHVMSISALELLRD